MEEKKPTEPVGVPSDQGKKFGTIEGVFLPNILCILGVIMYLRQGMVMGQAGLIYGVLIILLANVVTFITALSLSAVSTNMRVKAGGAYYIISRSLGIEWGGCIGIPFAVSQTLSIALYTLGFAESLRMMGDVPSFHFISIITLQHRNLNISFKSNIRTSFSTAFCGISFADPIRFRNTSFTNNMLLLEDGYLILIAFYSLT